RMELLASINKPTRSGKSVSASKCVICLGGRLLSRILNWSSLRSRMNFPCLSVTVKIRFTSSVWVRKIGIWPLSGEPLDESGSTAAAAGLGEAWAVGGCTGTGNAGSFCAAARPPNMVIARKRAANLMGDRDNYSFPGVAADGQIVPDKGNARQFAGRPKSALGVA